MEAKTLVLSLLFMGVWGGLLSLGALALCAVLRKIHAPSRLLCLVWLAVGLRFLLPGGIPVTVPQPAAQVLERTGGVPSVQPEPAETVPEDAAALTPLPAQSETPRPDGWVLAAAVWGAGTLVLLLRAAHGYRRLHRQVALACLTPDGCYSCSAVTVPFTLGLVRPRIYLPDSLQGPAREAVLLHERTHIRRGDTVTKPLFYLAACLHWWNPLVWLAFRQFERAMESACDEAAVGRRPAPERAAYCEIILQFAAGNHPVPGALAFGQGSVRERIVHLLRYRAPGRAALVYCAAAVAVACAACMVQPRTAEADPVPVTSTAEDAQSLPTPSPIAEDVQSTPAPSPTAAPQTGEQSVTPAVSDSDLQEKLDIPEGSPNTTQDLPDSALATELATDGSSGSFVPQFVLPLTEYNYVSRGFGSNLHRGVDYAAPAETPVLAAAGGTVLAAGYNYILGYYVVLDHGNSPQGDRYATLYAHLYGSPAVAAGDAVTAGQTIGAVGSTGNSTGNHLHLELLVNGEPIDPADCGFPVTREEGSGE